MNDRRSTRFIVFLLARVRNTTVPHGRNRMKDSQDRDRLPDHMNPHQRRQLEAALDAMGKVERNRLFKEAAERRLLAQKSRRKSEREVDVPPGRRRADPLREWAIKILAERDRQSTESAVSAQPSPGPDGVVVRIGRRRCTVEHDGRLVECLLSPDQAGAQHEDLAVGDRVLLAPGEGRDPARVARVLPRQSELSRPDPRRPGRRRVIVANVDVVVIVVSVVAPPLHPRLIDRYLVAVQRGGGRAVICVNKIDCLAPGDRSVLEVLEPYRRVGIRVIETSAHTGEGIADLQAELRGCTCALVGHSGVGKSSLANALDPALGAKVGEISGASHRGRHTTVASSLHLLPGDIRLIDTPGVRSLSLEDMSIGQVREAFPEFLAPAEHCRYRDCTHTHEPGCRVRDAAARDEIPPARYETYRRILQDLDATDTGDEHSEDSSFPLGP
ncbi:MAG: ribosome small subunit-dependent GTPase A [Leptolyngbya sp. PLA3]|nr:ribosome small subunit-dependent GTPase A [Leptolyngbya sp. PL-A3]